MGLVRNFQKIFLQKENIILLTDIFNIKEFLQFEIVKFEICSDANIGG